MLWVVLSPTEGEWPYALAAVTADPAEGEAFTEAGANLVETVAMPDAIREAVEALSPNTMSSGVRQAQARSRADPEALARRRPEGGHE